MRLVLIVLLLALSACSNKAMYQTLQQHEKSKCVEGLQIEYDECMKRHEKTFEEYERERKSQLKQKNNTP